jgi:hypothetical protein
MDLFVTPSLHHWGSPWKALHCEGPSGKGFSETGAVLFCIGMLARVQKLVCISASVGYWLEVLFVNASFCYFPDIVFLRN